MRAYSGTKKHNNFNQTPRSRGAPMQLPPPPPPFGRGGPEMAPQTNYADHRMQNAGRPPYYGPGPVRSPMPMINPHPNHQHHGFSNQTGTPGYHHPSGNFSSGPRPGLQWARPDSPSYGFPQGQGTWVNNSSAGRGGSPFPNPGRGRGEGPRGPGPVRPGYNSGGIVNGYRGGTAPRNLYQKFMVEDPWKDLEPVAWKKVTPTSTSTRIFESFRNSSPSVKKPRVGETQNSSDSKESLADYLAAAFDEAVEEVDAP